MSYSLHPAADLELAAAAEHYRVEAGAVIAEQFLNEFERLMKLLERNPELGIAAGKKRRTFPFRRFPYSLVYRAADTRLRVLVIAHQHRRPGYGRDRS